MPPLTNAIQVLPPEGNEEEVEDIFASAPGLIFPDDTRNSHGDAGATIVYKSARFGEVELKTADPVGEGERLLFGHYLWNAGIKLAGLVGEEGDHGGEEGLKWRVEGEDVLELGSGVGLVGIVATLAGAKRVVLSDYPAPAGLDNLRQNAARAIPAHLTGAYRIQGHQWGELTSTFAQDNQHAFTRILAADCLWMSHQHLNLVHSILHFMTLDPAGRALVVAGFHTGRETLAAFFDICAEQGLSMEEIYEEDVHGVKKEWVRERTDGATENVTERKQWLVIARLKRA
ncbi:hypothetical protein BDY17DRAFT_245438 [Neohortaea acidophila]|uniref:Methyltransferase-domain-containing protein n=1 Tax=Neohortaea acidophila TaxID=245834 RepID=A0A6A6Q3E2_9PEZI|nr:uncharacterized protein BDY17DRAFT_245438 [Neohortaea acidophila]KAF2486561.1 hypothetical protein BDY17DRAFT_245438 [Neohortaea acidophila]